MTEAAHVHDHLHVRGDRRERLVTPFRVGASIPVNGGLEARTSGGRMTQSRALPVGTEVQATMRCD